MQEQVNQLQEQVKFLTEKLSKMEVELNKNNFSNELIFEKNVTFKGNFGFADGVNIPIGATTGTKIGSASSKIGFFGKTPIGQPSGISSPSGGATIDTQSRNAIDAIRTALINLGLTA